MHPAEGLKEECVSYLWTCIITALNKPVALEKDSIQPSGLLFKCSVLFWFRFFASALSDLIFLDILTLRQTLLTQCLHKMIPSVASQEAYWAQSWSQMSPYPYLRFVLSSLSSPYGWTVQLMLMTASGDGRRYSVCAWIVSFLCFK